MTNWSQPGIYNVLDAGLSPAPSTSGIANAQKLQTLVGTVENQGGGIILIPSDDATTGGNGGVYNMATQVGVPYAVQLSGNAPILFLGTGGATTLKMQSSGSLFYMPPTTQTFTGLSLGFQDLLIEYQQTVQTPLSGTALNLANASNVRLFRVLFQDCQNPVSFYNILQGSILQCAMLYTSAFPVSLGATGIIIGAPGAQNGSNQIDIDSCSLMTDEAISGSIALLITKVTQLRARNSQLIGFATGVSIAPAGSGGKADNSRDMWFEALAISATTSAVSIAPTGSPLPITSNVTFANCDFVASGSSAPAGVSVGGSGIAPALIDTLRFEHCNCTGFTNGLVINSAQHVIVLGGSYSGNLNAGILLSGSASNVATDIIVDGTLCTGAAAGGSATQQYGVLIQNGATGILVVGCQLMGNLNSGGLVTAAIDVNVHGCDLTSNSQYAVGITGSCQNVYMDGCNLSGYSTNGPLYLSSPGTLQVTNCPGYNDQGRVVGRAIPTTQPFNSASFGYYGPITFYVGGPPNAHDIKLGTADTSLIAGTFSLAAPAPNGSSYAGANATITYDPATPPPFLVIGE